MHALTVRWSLEGAPDGVEESLAAYVAETSHARFTGLPGLRFKTWRVRTGEWFEGCYVFETDAAPVLIEASDVVAVAEGGAGFLAAPSYA